MDKTFGHFDHAVEPFCDDVRGLLSWSKLGGDLLRAAQCHAASGGFGYEAMKEMHHAWVLSRLVIEMDAFPRTGEPYAIETWVSRVYRQFTDRHFAILRGDGTPCGFADSVWALIDTATRQPLDLASLPHDGITPYATTERATHLVPPLRKRMTAGEKVREYRVQYSDLDVNGHLNSVRYLTLLMDVLAEATGHYPDVRRAELAFASECLFGDDLHILCEPHAAEGFHLYEIRKAADGSLAFKGALLNY